MKYFKYSKSTPTEVLMEILFFRLSWLTEEEMFQASYHSNILEIEKNEM